MSAGCAFARAWLLAALFVAPARAASADLLQDIDTALAWESAGGTVRLEASGLVDIEAYYIDQEPPGLVFEDDDEVFVQPRLTLLLDTFFGERLYAFVQARADRGFDPGLEDPDARFDEYFARYSLLERERLAVQVGKFATVVGNFVGRHQSWDNPLVNAPLVYENVTTVGDKTVTGHAAFLARKDQVDNKRAWVPVVWGPSYATGAALLGSVSRLSWAVEVKNAALSSRPKVWDDYDDRWKHPTASARVAWTPAPAWVLGASASRGAYLRPEAEDALASGKDIGDYPQTTVAADLAYAYRQLQIFSELFLSRFEVPGIGDADTLAYYVEAKYDLTLRWFAAARFGQQLFDEVADGTGGRSEWDQDVWRAEVGLGLRLTRHLQAKLQYGFTDREGPIEQGEQLVAVQVTARF